VAKNQKPFYMRPSLLLLIGLLALASCQKKTLSLPADIWGLAMPVTLYGDSTITLLAEDYFNDPGRLASVEGTMGVQAVLSADRKNISLTVRGEAPFWAQLHVAMSDGVRYAIPLRGWRSNRAPEAAAQPRLETVNFLGDSLRLRLHNGVVGCLAFWENTPVPIALYRDQAIVHLPALSRKVRRSTLRIYGWGTGAPSNDVLVPLEYGSAIQNPERLDRNDYEAQIMYFPFVDRFHNGNPGNDRPIQHPGIGPKQNFQGGDLAGITQKIRDGYFKKFRINCLWLSPITQNPEGPYQEFVDPQRWYTGYHGYWPISSSKVDHRFGSEEELRELVRVAHENDINVILDFVAHHVHVEHPMAKKYPSTVFDLPDGRKNIRLWDGETRTTTWFDTFIPTLDLSKEEVIAAQSDSALFWVKKFGLDGYRHDAAKHIPNAFWRTMTQKLKREVMLPENRKLYQIGETYGGDSLIASFLGNGLMECQFDFNLFFTARDAFADKGNANMRSVADALRNSLHWYGHHSTMGYITGNHDQPRFMAYAGKGLGADENDREAGWSREIGIVDPEGGFAKQQCMLAFIFSLPGVPVLYYGDEIGMTGANDPDNRRMMRFDGLNERELATRQLTEKLAALRASNMPLIYGDTELLLAGDTQLAFARSYLGRSTIVVFNDGDAPATVSVPLGKHLSGTYRVALSRSGEAEGQQISAADGRLELSLPSHGFAILTR
jgi:glycosidase